jgi:protoheme IX farnesyltransferase
MPALMGSTAVTGRFDVVGTALFAFVFLWQLPHFLAIAIYREHEYSAAGHKVVPAVWGMTSAKWIMLGTSVALAVSGVALFTLGIGGPAFGVVAALLGLAFVGLCARGLRRRTSRDEDDAWARAVFRASLVYQTLLIGALVVDRVLFGAS